MFIEAGVALLREHGLGAGSDVLTLKAVRDRVESDHGIRFVNASLIGRIWKDQSDFQTDVLTTIALDDSNDEVEHTLDLVAPLLAGLDVRSAAARRWSLQEMCRTVSAVHLATLQASTDWALWIGVLAITAVGPPTERRERIDSALRQSYADVTVKMETIYSSLLAFLGFRLRDGLSVRQFAVAAAALTEGCVLRDRVDPMPMQGIVRPTGRDGEEQEWTLFGLALHALAEQFFDLDPAWEVERALRLRPTTPDETVGRDSR